MEKSPIGYLYCGEITEDGRDYRFTVTEIPVYDSKNSGLFGQLRPKALDRELKISDTRSEYYSYSKEACVAFLEGKHQKMLLDAKFEYEKVKHAVKDYNLKEEVLEEEESMDFAQ